MDGLSNSALMFISSQNINFNKKISIPVEKNISKHISTPISDCSLTKKKQVFPSKFLNVIHGQQRLYT